MFVCMDLDCFTCRFRIMCGEGKGKGKGKGEDDRGGGDVGTRTRG